MKTYLVYCLAILGLFYMLDSRGVVIINWVSVLESLDDGSGSSYGGGYHK